MKFSKHYFLQASFVLLILTVVLNSGCGGNDPKPDEAEKTKKLLTSGVWKLQSLTIDGDDNTALYRDLTVRFTANGYTSAGGEPVWAASGTWSFIGETTDRIERNDDIVVTILNLEKNILSLEFVWDETILGSGKTAAISGVHVFTFTK